MDLFGSRSLARVITQHGLDERADVAVRFGDLVQRASHAHTLASKRRGIQRVDSVMLQID